MNNNEFLRQILAEQDQDFSFIKLNASKNREMTRRIAQNPAADEYDYAALGFTIHNLFNAFESYFFRIAKFFENNVGDLTWHKTLLERMTLQIEGIRPALLPLGFAQRVEELLKFRHVYRNMYKSPLVPAKVLFANSVALDIDQDFNKYHLEFCQFVRDLIVELSRIETAP